MKISYQWLKQYFPTQIAAEELSVILTDCGLEVESVEPYESVKGALSGVVVGHVMECIKHPNADKLSLTKVDVGTGELLKIVCGAPNVAEGQKVLVATVGTTIYTGDSSFVIQKAKIRGEASEGMLCAEDELGIGTSHAGIMILKEDAQVGMAAADLLGIYHDTVFEIGLTPNRVDAASHLGVARDLLAAVKLHSPERLLSESLVRPDVSAFPVGDQSLEIAVIVENEEACPRYSCVTISGLKVGESPEWLKNLLKAIGLRPINNVVDITNYVLMELGQPLHAFDAAKIKGNKVIVKTMPEGSAFTTLDGVERKLSGNDLMICNAEEGMCIGGVFGGLDSGVNETTTSIFLESACFNPVYVRRTSKLHGLKTDASFRFERGSDPDITVYALKRAAMLMCEIAGGTVSSSIKDHYPKPVKLAEVNLRYQKVDRLIGKKIPHDVVKTIITSLEMKIIEESETELLVQIPAFKVDVLREADIIEEILRVYGYNQVEISQEISFSMVATPIPDRVRLRNVIADQFVGMGFSEIMCNSLTRAEYASMTQSVQAENWVKILNPLSKDLEVMRTSLLFGGLETVLWNQNRRQSDLSLFEFGSIYKNTGIQNAGDSLAKYFEEEQLSLVLSGKYAVASWYHEEKEVDFFYLKACVHKALRRFGLSPADFRAEPLTSDLFQYGLNYCDTKGESVLEFGEVSASLLKHFDIKVPVFYAVFHWEKFLQQHLSKTTRYAELPRFPEVRRDLALLLDKSVQYSQIEAIAWKNGGELLKQLDLFDVYEGKGIGEDKKSYAVSFFLRDAEKTLKDEDIDQVMNKLIAAFTAELGASLR